MRIGIAGLSITPSHAKTRRSLVAELATRGHRVLSPERDRGAAPPGERKAVS